jgi:hypothetical protein
MTDKQQAAASLAQRALASLTHSESDLLISAAKALDPKINTGELRAAWLEKFLTRTRARPERQSYDYPTQA